MASITKLIPGKIRLLTQDEKQLIISGGGSDFYCYVTEDTFTCELANGKKIVIPSGFLSDGSSGGPDYGYSWLFHDWLYSTHKFSNDSLKDNNDHLIACSRQEADSVMKEILGQERFILYPFIFNFLSSFDVFGLFTKAWNASGTRGPQFLYTYMFDNPWSETEGSTTPGRDDN